MKCEFCSGNMSIENERCPHCDAENPYYKAHRADMAEYARRFAATQSNVENKTNKFARRTFGITVSAVLVAINVVLILLLINMRDINYARDYNRNTKKAPKIAKEVGALEDARDYIAMSNYTYSINMKTYQNAMAEYNYVLDVANNYRRFVEKMNRIVLNDMGYLSISDVAKNINTFLESVYDVRYVQYEKQKLYNSANGPDYFSEKHLNSMDEMIGNMHAMLKTYLGFDDETIASFRDMSSTQRQLLIEERITEVVPDAE